MTSVFSIRAIFFACIFNLPAFAQGIGDIAFDAALDDPNFKLCNPERVFQGYQLKSKEDETSLMVEREFRNRYHQNDTWSKETGLIRIRFVVNCSGVADRFRILEAGPDMQPAQLNSELKAHLVSIAKSIPWPARRGWDQTVDYYHHVSIWIRDGKIEVVQ